LRKITPQPEIESETFRLSGASILSISITEACSDDFQEIYSARSLMNLINVYNFT